MIQAWSPSSNRTGEPDSPGIESHVSVSEPADGTSVLAVHRRWADRIKGWSPPYPARAIYARPLRSGKSACGIARIGMAAGESGFSSAMIAQSFLTISDPIWSHRGRSSNLNLKSGDVTKDVAIEWPTNLS